MQSFGNLVSLSHILYTFVKFFQGPGDMLGLVSAESFATPVRGTLYGLSAGKKSSSMSKTI